jgi:OOP family OmpA-OmpF porin
MKCPSCGYQPLPQRANFCRSCGVNIKTFKPPQQEPVNQNIVESEKIQATVNLTTADAPSIKAVSNTKKSIVIPIIVGVLVLLLGVGFWGYQQKITADQNAALAAKQIAEAKDALEKEQIRKKELDEMLQQQQAELAKQKAEAARQQAARQLAEAEIAKQKAEAERRERDAALKAAMAADARAELERQRLADQERTAALRLKYLDGNWYSKQWKYGYKLKDGVGIATVTNSPNFQVGQKIIQLTATSDTTFTGQQLYTDGQPYKINVTLQSDGRLYFEGEKNIKWHMEKVNKTSTKVELFFAGDQVEVAIEGQKFLDQVVSFVGKLDLDSVVLQGYSAPIQSEPVSLDISRRRAIAAKSYLVSKGLDASRIFVEAKGIQNPIGDNKTPAGRAQNNRVNIEIVGYKKE